MKRSFIIACILLLFTISVKAVPANFPKGSSYWVTETGPRSNPYTIIRLYDEENKQFLEILMNGYRLKTGRQSMIKRLNRLANETSLDSASGIAAILHIEACRVSSVKRISESYFAKIK